MATATRTFAIQYEDFNPSFQWKEEQASNLLLLHLPEFQKEEMKITYVHSSRIIRVTGEHPISNNKWRRFNQSFPVPDNCNVQRIQAKFQSPTLTITLPKITPSSSSSSIPPNQNQDHTQKPDATDHAPTKKQENQEFKPTDKIKKQETQELKQPDGNDISKKQDQVNHIPRPPQETLTQTSKKQDQFNPIPQMTELPPSTVTAGDQEKDEKNKNNKEDHEGEINNSKKRKELMRGEAPNASDHHDQEIIKKSRKEDKIGTSSEMINYGEKAKQVTKRIMEFGREISEDKQTLVNIGVAVLVIAALGAYIYSSSKD